MRMCVIENSPAPVVCYRERPREPQQANQGGQQSPADSKGTLTRCSERSRCVRQHSKISTIRHDKKVVYPSHGPPARCSRSRPDRWQQKAACSSRSSTPTTMEFGHSSGMRCYSAKGASWTSGYEISHAVGVTSASSAQSCISGHGLSTYGLSNPTSVNSNVCLSFSHSCVLCELVHFSGSVEVNIQSRGLAV